MMRNYLLTLALIGIGAGCESNRKTVPETNSRPSPELPSREANLVSPPTIASTSPSASVPAQDDTSAKTARDEWEQAAVDVRRISPDSLQDLPSAVREELKRRNCSVPQTYAYSEPHNAVNGAFTAKGELEWAVICSVDLVSQILVLNARTGAVVDSLGKGDDKNWIQGIGDGKYGFSRKLGVVTSASIGARTVDDYDQSIPQPIDHDWIDVYFLDKASVAYYRSGAQWYRIITSD
jgi:hypothetical protein